MLLAKAQLLIQSSLILWQEEINKYTVLQSQSHALSQLGRINNIPGENSESTLSISRAFRLKCLKVMSHNESSEWIMSERSAVCLGGRDRLISLNVSKQPAIVVPAMFGFLMS